MLMMLKICAIAVVGLVLIALIRSYKPEFTVEAVLCVSIILLYYALDSLRYGFVYMQNLYSRLTYGQEYFPIILKVLAIAYATEFTAAPRSRRSRASSAKTALRSTAYAAKGPWRPWA